LGTICSVCGARLDAGSKFCDGCGASLASPEASQAAFPGLASPNSYTPGHLAEKILTSKAALEGERKQVTVLFADMKGSTEYVAGLDPHDARRVLDPILNRMMEAVHRYEGTVNQVMGDGIMAIFGAPLAHEDHAIRACYSALEMQVSIGKYAEEVHRTEGVLPQIRIGLNSGEVIVRSIGNDLHMNYTAQGLTTHLAARMEQMAVPGTILMTSQTLHLVQRYVSAKPLGPMLVKGLTAPIETHELLGANILRSRLQAIASRGMTRFVGRSDEMHQLRQALVHANAGRGQVLAVVGEPGAGKSRVIHEFIHLPQTDGWRILEAEAKSYGTATSYLPITEVLREYFQVTTSDEPAVISAKVTSKLLSLDELLLPMVPALLVLLDLTPNASDSWALDAPKRRQRTLEAVKRVLLRESEAQPVLWVLEDLHSIDSETQALIDGLVDGLPAARFLLLVSYRPEYQHGWGNKTYYTQLRIDPLSPAAAYEMLDSLVGTDIGLESLKRLLIEKTEGNPLFIEESVRMLVETGTLTGEPGAYRAANSISDFPPPVTIEALLASRIDRLSPPDKRLLQFAAVVGSPAPLGVLETIGEFSPDDVRQALVNLQASEFLYETRVFPNVEYTFKHALIHDVAYQMLSPDRRRVLHAAALLAGEELYSNQASEKADWLAFHALRAKLWDRAVTHLQVAAARASARSANRVAVQHLENALVAVDHLPIQERTGIAIDLRIDLRHALTPLGQVRRTLDHLNAAEQLAIELNDRSKLGRVVSFTANCLVLLGQYRDGLITGGRALAIARELGDRRLELATRMYMARARRSLGEHQTAIEMFREVGHSLNEIPVDDFLGLPVLPAATALSQLAVSLAEVGAFEEAEAQAHEAARRSDASRHPDSVMWSYWSIGSVALLRGASGEAVRVFDRLLNLCRTYDLEAYVSRNLAALGCAKARSGQVDEGLLLLEEAVALDRLAEPRTTHSFALTALSEAALLAGDLGRALTTVTQALQQIRSHEERGAEAYACWLLANIHSTYDSDIETTAEMFETAIAIATELHLKPLLAHCHLGIAALYLRRSRRPQGNAHRDRGQHLLETLGMKPWIQIR
jgi:class 3 adenylate cyclase/tetratricopeptide (TPR) repeat protein